MLALTNSEGTPWRPEKERKPRPRQTLMVTFPGRLGGLDAANFYAEVLDQQEVADMLLMVFTFDPNKVRRLRDLLATPHQTSAYSGVAGECLYR